MPKAVSNAENLRSPVWNHFHRDTVNQVATCTLCNARLKCIGGSTRSLHVHLQSKHKINLLKRDAEGDGDDDSEATSPVPGQSAAAGEGEPGNESAARRRQRQGERGKLTNYFGSGRYNSMAATISRMTACDGLSFRAFSSSPDMRRLLASAGYSDLPKSPTAIQALVVKHAGEIQLRVKSEIKLKLKEGKRFSLTFDEWTSLRNRRYMVINVHEGEGHHWGLGLVRVEGSMPAEKCILLLKRKLEAFGLNLHTDIVGICTDGASVMCKVGKLIDVQHQLCLAHGIHLAVHDVLYKRTHSIGSYTETIVTESGEAEAAHDAGDHCHCCY